MSKPASQDELANLHVQLATVLLEAIKSPEPPSAILNVARQFLKDNGIEALPTKGSALGEMASILPFPSQEDFKKA